MKTILSGLAIFALLAFTGCYDTKASSDTTTQKNSQWVWLIRYSCKSVIIVYSQNSYIIGS